MNSNIGMHHMKHSKPNTVCREAEGGPPKGGVATEDHSYRLLTTQSR